jgi:hypothetical protein
LNLNGIALAESFLNDLPLTAEQETLPTHGAGALVIFRHQIGAFVEDLNKVCLGSLELKHGESGFVLLHLSLR